MNELEKRARYHKKHNKGQGYFVKYDAGNVEHNIDVFNNSVSTSTNGTGESEMGESVNRKRYSYFGPIKEFSDTIKTISESDPLITYAETPQKAYTNFCFQAKRLCNRTYNSNIKIIQDNIRLDENMNKKINIKEALNKIDSDNFCEYDLVNLYESQKLSQDEKKYVAKLLSRKESPEVIYEYLYNKYEGLSMKEAVKGPLDSYWYFTKHGVQPGSVPKDISISNVLETSLGTYFASDKIITTSELKEYDIKEKIPSEEEIRKYSDDTDNLNESYDLMTVDDMMDGYINNMSDEQIDSEIRIMNIYARELGIRNSSDLVVCSDDDGALFDIVYKFDFYKTINTKDNRYKAYAFKFNDFSFIYETVDGNGLLYFKNEDEANSILDTLNKEKDELNEDLYNEDTYDVTFYLPFFAQEDRMDDDLMYQKVQIKANSVEQAEINAKQFLSNKLKTKASYMWKDASISSIYIV